MSKPIRILFFSSGMAPEYGGAAISEASLCQALENKAKVTVACREDRWNRKFVRGFGINNILEFSPSDFFKCWRDKQHPIWSWFNNIDVVHLNGHWRWEYYFISKICNQLAIPYILHPRGMMLVDGRKLPLKRAFNLLIGKKIAQSARQLVALSKFETFQLKPYDLSVKAISIIPNGVCGSGNSDAYSNYPVISDHFLYFGRLEHRKNLLFLLESFARYRQLGGTKKLRLKGPVEHGYEQLVHQKITELHLGHHVSLLAPSYGADKWKHLGQAIAVVYPCLDEPFGRVPFEALLAGSIPIVPTESGGAEYLGSLLPESIYPTDQVDALAQRLLWAEKLDLDQRNLLLKEAKLWVQTNLDWKKVSERVIQLYRTTTSNESASPLVETDFASPHPAL